jgi:heme/copper-type cytochrome/quinol oxidase subunit 3
VSTRTRSTLDVSGLPTETYGARSLPWWATVGFIAIEGTTLLICAVTYLYLRRNFPQLPPARVAVPGLGAALANVVLMLVSLFPNHLLSRAAVRQDLSAIRVLLTVGLLFNLAFVVLRWFELMQLHVRWDLNAYGSSAWLVLVTHGTLLLLNVLETAVMCAMAWTGRWEAKHFSDVVDAALYWYFMVLSWMPLFALVFLLPRSM